MSWWIWILLGVILLAAELATPGGFYLFFFGIGALVVGALVGVIPATPEWIQWFLFPVISVGALVQFRHKLLGSMQRSDTPTDVDSFLGEEGVAMNVIDVGLLGKIELRGTTWNAKNVGARSISQGERCRVASVEGLTLHVLPK